jgi:predicted ATPase/tRNA A-37 threonylcarbamoyl transferase component Bud32/Tfp pilus assembly protein PilF
MALAPGTRLGPHEILAPLGQGGMGEVYRARDTRLHRELAIKILPAALASDRERLRLLEHEARSASALNHPNIVTIYEIGEAGSTFYIAMELVEGASLRDLVLAGPLPLRRLLSIAAQIADGLAKAHGAGIVHRDLKPENLMVSNDGFVKILDFGLAKLVPVRSESAADLSTSSHEEIDASGIAGTVGYMSPEQASGKPLDFRSDQFALGAVLYELATGVRAFRRDTPVQTLAAILEDDPEPIASLNARLPAPFCWIVERCLSKDPDERYASTRDLARDLAALREHLLEAPAETRGARPANLPQPRTRFVGREKERAALRALLERADVRIMSLTGFGGIGKTRLALQVAEDMSARFPAGVSFVPLDSARDADQMVAAICRTIGVRETTGETLRNSLKEHLAAAARAPMLLVLDNFEQLLSAAPTVADLVAAGPELKVVVTSRSPLHVYGEHEFPVPPLALPDLGALPSLERLTQYESVALFLQRAQAVKPDFALTKENAPVIAEICARLDGLPLALELAAARVKLLSPSAMQSRLEKRLQLLTGGALDLPARQRTLRGAIEWSYDLLNEDEQKLFRRLSVFVDGCTLEAAEAVCNAKDDLGLDPLDGMSSMVDKSLVRQIETEGEEPRFVMLETIREYALERLTASGDEAITRRAHAAYGLVLAEEVGSARVAAVIDSAEWLDRCEREHENFRAALDWLCRKDEAQWGLRLGAALFQFWERREYITEGKEWLTRLLDLPGAVARDKVRARAVFAAGVLAGAQKDYQLANTLFTESLAINRETDDKWAAAVSLNALAVTALDQRDVAAARSLSEQNLEVWRELGDRAAVARSLSNLASVVKEQGEYGLARSLYDEALSIFRETGDPTAAARVLNKLGDVARDQGDTAEAQKLYDESLEAFREFGDRWGTALALADLGNLARERRDFPSARSLYRDSLRIFHELDYKRGVAQVLENLACADAGQGEARRALALAGSAAALRHNLGTPLGSSEQAKLEASLESARKRLAGSEGASAWMEGWTTPLEKTVEAALGGDAG